VRHVRMLGLCLVAVLALGAYAVSSASALPEWGKCVAKAGGKYTDSNCTTKGKGGSYEWEKGKTLSPVKFTGHNVGSGGVLQAAVRYCARIEGNGAEWRTETRKACAEKKGWKEYKGEENGASEIECEAESSSGEAVGAKSIANVNVTFKGCALFGAFPCNSTGLKEGEIKTSLLKGSLGYINKSKKEVGVLLEPATKHGHFADFACIEGIQVDSVGVGNSKEGAAFEPENKGGNDQVISPIVPINQMTSEYTQVYSTESEWPFSNLPLKLEGKARSSLEAKIDDPSANEFADWSAAGERITNVNTPEEPGEIKG
jgi:hypothetical protein